MIAVIVILSLMLIIAFAAVLFDIIPFAENILKRRGMGSLSFGDDWYKAAESTAEKWLKNGVPIVPKKSESRLVIIDIIKGDYKVKAIQSWQEAPVLCAVNNGNIARNFINKKLSENIFDTDRVDVAMLAYAMLDKGEKNELKPYMDKVFGLITEKYERTGRVPYSKEDNICFVDTVGLVCPFLAEYAVKYNSEYAAKIAVSVIKNYYENGFHKDFGLPVHCFNANNNAPLGLYGWGRGCGWWAAGLADTYNSFNKSELFNDEKSYIKQLIEIFADDIIKYQRADGGFDRNVLYFSGADSAATSMIAWFLCCAGDIFDNDKYSQASKKAMYYICSVTRKDGTVDYSQGDTTGPGFYSTASIVVPAAQGFALRTYRFTEGGMNK